MPTAVSKRQWRFMQAILHGKAKGHPRGTPPKSIAGKYSGPGKDAPEQSGSNTGGTWGAEHHSKAKEKVKADRITRKKSKKVKKSEEIKKAFEDFYKGRGAGCVVVDKDGKILIGKRADDKLWTTPGGHAYFEEEDFQAAARELQEETGLQSNNMLELHAGRYHGNECRMFLVTDYSGTLKPQKDELTDLKFVHTNKLPFDKLRPEAADGIWAYLNHKETVKKSLRNMMAIEELKKNIERGLGHGESVLEITHGDSLKLVGNGAFRMLRQAVKDMQPEEFRDVTVDNYKLFIRKHINDMYSGRIEDGHKVVHQFTNKSLPQLTAEIMSVFEWYLPEDEPELITMDDGDLTDDAIDGGLQELINNYKKHNLANIYEEMENIRSEIRQGNAVDLQQVEQKIMKLFEKLEDTLQHVASKHNKLSDMTGNDIDELEQKLIQLQSKVDELSTKPSTVEAFSAYPTKHKELLENDYCYLSKPTVEISPNGKIKITFSSDWNPLDKENLLRDMRARVISKKNS